MRKSLFLAVLVLMSATCFAQKANVKKAKNLILQEEPDFAAARMLIGEAIQNDETKNDANTWYVAGLIGFTECDQMNRAQVLGQTIDEERKGQAVEESYDYFVKADELAMIPTLDKKGREVVDTKTRKSVISKMMDFYNNQDLIKYGIYLNDQREFRGAYEAFIKHIKLQDLPMMQDDKLQAKMPKDTIYYQYYYYAGLFATQAEMHNEAVEVFEAIKNGLYEPIVCNQLLFQEYQALKDTVKAVLTLKDAIVRFPEEPWFLQNLINHYIFSGQIQQAIDYLNEAIEREPNVAQYHYIKGNLDENQRHQEAALADFDRALQLDPKMADAVAGKGRVYYNNAVRMNEEAANISDAKAYKKALEDMNAEFRKSLPFFEEAHQMEPDNRDYMITLRTLYYRFDMNDKYEAIKAELNK